ncbi:hypothetical protein [Winogradskyella helgolandensis]|uniref:hypothetical protein n=1 Tax=Winogradskyella helgolandensis TaxID=2697010 RepID=UPI0015CBA2B0|nr:hypothetical protein [Winogradskyella helgolandensis]
MKLRFRYILFIVSTLFLTNCTYDFSEDSFKDIQTNNPNVNVILTGFSNGEQTSSSKIIQYTITGAGNNEFEMIVKIDGTETYRSQETTGEFYLYVDELTDGEHELTIEYAFPTNSGSLADALNGEFFVGLAEYNFIVDKTLANPFGIASININQGSIFITLNPILDNNFDEAFLVIKNEYDFIIEERPISQEDLSDLQIHDDQTIFYNPSYAIKLKNSFTEDISDFVLLPTTKMNFSIEPLLYREFKLIYNEHPLYGNFDTIGLSGYTYPFSGGAFVNLNPQGGETIIDKGFYFGGNIFLNFKIFKNNSLFGELNEQIPVGDSLPISEFEDITYVPSINKYFIVEITNSNELMIYQLNAESFEIENSQILTTLSFSEDFNSLEFDNNSDTILLNLKEKALVFNPMTFSIANTYNAVDFNANKANADTYFRGNYIILEDSWASGEVLIYDISTGIQKFGINKTTNFFSAIDASYFYANGDLYKLDFGEFVFLNTIQDSRYNTDAPDLEHMTFDKLSNSAVFGWYRSTFYLDLSNYNQTYIWDTEIVYDVKYTDTGKPFINCNHFSAGNRSHIYDINLNETKLIDTSFQQSYRYFNGYIFSPNGYVFESNLYTN